MPPTLNCLTSPQCGICWNKPCCCWMFAIDSRLLSMYHTPSGSSPSLGPPTLLSAVCERRDRLPASITFPWRWSSWQSLVPVIAAHRKTNFSVSTWPTGWISAAACHADTHLWLLLLVVWGSLIIITTIACMITTNMLVKSDKTFSDKSLILQSVVIMMTILEILEQ